MIVTPVLLVRFDIDKIDGGAYGYESYLSLFRAVPVSMLEGCILFSGDSQATLYSGSENVNVVGISNLDTRKLEDIKVMLEANEELAKILSDNSPFIVSVSGSSEPLVLDGNVRDGTIIGNGGWAASALEKVKKEAPVKKDEVPKPESASKQAPVNPAPENALTEMLNKLLKNGAVLGEPKITYKELPKGVSPARWLNNDSFISGFELAGKPFNGNFLIYSLSKGVVLPSNLWAMELTQTGNISFLTGGKVKALFNLNFDKISPDGFDELKDLGFGIIGCHRGRVWSLYSVVKGEILSSSGEMEFAEIGAASDTSVAVRSIKEKKTWHLISPDGTKLLSCECDEMRPFVDDIYMVRTGENWEYRDRGGKAIYKGGKKCRHFCNGDAVISDEKGKKLGTIDKSGHVTIAPQYHFLKDCDYGMHICSNSGSYQPDDTFTGNNFGVVDASGNEIIPRKHVTVQIKSENVISVGYYIAWIETNAQTRTQYKRAVTGLFDNSGKELLPVRYVDIGTTSEGLAPFIAFDKLDELGMTGTISLGYMDEQGKTVISLGDHSFTAGLNSAYSDLRTQRILLTKKADELMGPFINGTARVYVRKRILGSVEFVKDDEHEFIDRSGNPVRNPGVLPASTSCDDRTVDRLYASLTGEWAKAAKPISQSAVIAAKQIRKWSGGYEMRLSSGAFIIFDNDMKPVLSAGEPKAGSLSSDTTHEEYIGLEEKAQNVYTHIVNAKANIIISPYETPTVFTNGIAAAIKKTGWLKKRFGFVDKTGKWVIEPKFRNVKVASNNRIAVENDHGIWSILSVDYEVKN